MDKLPAAFQTLVVAGRNEVKLRCFRLATQDRKHPTDVLGFCSNMNELMSVADLIITKPGGLTTSEAMVAIGPAIVYFTTPSPGQETANADYLLERGCRYQGQPPGRPCLFAWNNCLAQRSWRKWPAPPPPLGILNPAQNVCQAVLARCAKGVAGGQG